METNASLYTFSLCIQRPFKIVIRNLHHSTLSADILFALLEGHIVKQVHNVNKNKIIFSNYILSTSNSMIITIKSLTSLYYYKRKKQLKNQIKQFTVYCNVSIVKTMITQWITTIIYLAAINVESYESDNFTKGCSCLTKCVHCSEDHMASFKVYRFYQSILNRHKIKSSNPHLRYLANSPQFYPSHASAATSSS